MRCSVATMKTSPQDLGCCHGAANSAGIGAGLSTCHDGFISAVDTSGQGAAEQILWFRR
jgi:hypothetical protein